MLSLGLTVPTTEPWTFCALCPFCLPAGKKHHPWPCVGPGTVISNPFRLFLTDACWSILSWIFEGDCRSLESFLCTAPSSFLCSLPAWDSSVSQLRLQNRKSTGFCIDASPWSVLKDSKLKPLLGSPWLFLVYQVSCVAWSLNCKLLFYILCLFHCFRQAD